MLLSRLYCSLQLLYECTTVVLCIRENTQKILGKINVGNTLKMWTTQTKSDRTDELHVSIISCIVFHNSGGSRIITRPACAQTSKHWKKFYVVLQMEYFNEAYTDVWPHNLQISQCFREGFGCGVRAIVRRMRLPSVRGIDLPRNTFQYKALRCGTVTQIAFSQD